MSTESKSLKLDEGHPLYEEAGRRMEYLGARIGALIVAVRGIKHDLEGWEPEGMTFLVHELDAEYWRLADFLYGPNDALTRRAAAE